MRKTLFILAILFVISLAVGCFPTEYYKAMKPYIDIADDIKANAMSKFNQL